MNILSGFGVMPNFLSLHDCQLQIKYAFDKIKHKIIKQAKTIPKERDRQTEELNN